MDEITLTLPRHAVRFLAHMCGMHRKGLSAAMMDGMPTIQSEAAFDSLNTIESVIPDDIWKDTK